MSLVQAIQFRQLLSQLTDSETNQFLNQMSNIINTALFQFFLQPSNNQYADSTNNLLTKIITSRKIKPKTITTQNIKLDKFPKPLIGVISSFLTQYDYINFSKSNRFIYLGCNTPNLLQQLDITKVKNYSHIKFQLFQSVKTFKFNLNKFKELKMPSIQGKKVMNDLKSVSLFGEFKNDVDIGPFITQNYINITNVTTLILINFGNFSDPFDASKLNTLLKKFRNVEYFIFSLGLCNINANELAQTFPNLIGFDILATNSVQTSLVNTFGHKFRSLACPQYESNETYDDIDFGLLQELRIFLATKESVNIFKTAINVKKLYLCIDSLSESELLSISNETKEFIPKWIIMCKNLEYIKLKLVCDLFELILYGIKQGLFKTKKRKRERIKIELNIIYKITFKLTEYISNIVDVIDALQMSEIKDFMFILQFTVLPQKDVSEIPKNVFSNVNFAQCGSKLIFSNKNCRINGYNELWRLQFLTPDRLTPI